jgi:hypothetical protein
MMGEYFGSSFLVGSYPNATVSLSGADRRFRIAENGSPVPQDRIFFNFNHLHHALLDVNGATRSLQRFTFGFEKTFCGGDASLEMRLPFANTLNSLQSVGAADTRNTELGNLALALKTNLLAGSTWMLSGGTTMTFPTGDDFQWFQASTRELRIENGAVHMAPFLAYEVQPNRCCFAQAFVQADFDLNGNDVTTAPGPTGVLQDQNLLFVDASLGRWLRRSCDPRRCLSGIAAMAELHYTTTLNDTDAVVGIDNPFNRMDILNAAAVLHVQARRTAFRFGGVAPLRDNEERLYDAQVVFQLNRQF